MFSDKCIPCFGRIRFADLTLKPRLTERQDRQTDRRSVFFFLHVARRNSLRSNKNETLFCTRDVCVCVIQHRNWPLGLTIFNAHGTNASPDGLCTRTRNEVFSCWFCCDSFSIDRARRGNVCLEDQAKACSPTDQPARKFIDGLGINNYL